MNRNDFQISLDIITQSTDSCIDKLVTSIVSLISLSNADNSFLTINLPLVLDELLRNAVRHGNKGDSTKFIQLKVKLVENKLFIEIEDEGQGFENVDQSNTKTDESDYAGTGRGLLLVQSYCSELIFANRGSKVVAVLDINLKPIKI